MFREEVVEKIDRVLAPYHELWNSSRANVVKLKPNQEETLTVMQKGPQKGTLAAREEPFQREGLS